MKKGVNFALFGARYSHSKRAGKTKLLNELCDIYGYNRLTGKKYIRRGAKRRYEEKLLL